MKQILILFTVIFIYCYNTIAQEVILENDVDELYADSTGPNMRSYGHLYACWNFCAQQSEGEGGDIMPGRSFIFKTGYRHKFKLSPVFAVGMGVNYSFNHYLLKDDSTKIFPTAKIYDKERFRLHNLGFEAYVRINFDKRRGNYLGKYMDLGGYFTWIYAANNLVITNEYNDSTHSNITRIKYVSLNYVEPYSYGLTARIGYNKIALTADYRISDMFKPDFNFPEMPRLTVGFEFVID